MAVYVDEPIHKFRRMIMCHMFSDTSTVELHAMARRLGLRREWFQDDYRLPHYDVCKSVRAHAVKLGAVECDRKKTYEVMQARRRRAKR